ncbi:MAG: hypothetical protein O2967_14395 [Proteobacteria bacterium]|nr:hypothetical protein [Pseudomonadota bacterium]
MPMLLQILSERWKIAGITFLFLLLWALLLNFATDCFVVGTECSSNVHRSLSPILGYISTGQLRDGSNLDVVYTVHPVGYGMFLYAIDAYEGMRPFFPAIVLQGIFLFVSGLMVFSITKENWGPAAILAFALTIFNPNLIFVFFQPKEDGLFAFLVTCAMFAAFAYRRRPTWTSAIACGIAIGVATNVRPATYYLIFILPVLTVSVEFFADRTKNYFNAFIKGCAGTAIGFLLIFPWLSHVNSTGEGYGLTDHSLKLAWASDFRAMLEDTRVRSPNARDALLGSYDDASRKTLLTSFGPERAKLLSDTVAGWSDLGIREKNKLRYDDMMTQLKDYSVQTYLIAALPNLRFLLFSGGEGEFFKAFGIHEVLPLWMEKNPRLYMLVKVGFIGFSLILKMFALLGIWYLIRRGHYDVLVLFFGVILYFFLVHMYHGSPRYRAPIEPIFAIMAACGMINVKDWIGRTMQRH